MASRTTRAQSAQENLAILKRGEYVSPTGSRVSIQAELFSACNQSALFAPDQFPDVFRHRDEILRARQDQRPASFEVTAETTLHAARRLLTDDESARVLTLNFASARNPGGGFLKGSQAQEESLARASGLYACLTPHQAMYEANRRNPSCLYTDHMIYAPDVPVFRDDEDHLLERPYCVSILTAPAVNVGALKTTEPRSISRVGPVMIARIEKILSLAVVHGHDDLVLGAWGCGVFGNDPGQVAAWFASQLAGEGLFRAAFRKVVFAVFDRTPDRTAITPFERQFSRPS